MGCETCNSDWPTVPAILLLALRACRWLVSDWRPAVYAGAYDARS
jgi:hypothetical protein